MAELNAELIQLFGLTEDRLAELRQAEAPIVLNWDNFDLPEPQAREKVVGPMTSEEGQLFAILHEHNKRLDEMARKAAANSFRRLGDGIEKDSIKSAEDFQNTVQMSFEDEAEEREYYRLTLLTNHLKAMLFFTISERFNCHEWVIGVRSRGRVVKSVRRLDAGM